MASSNEIPIDKKLSELFAEGFKLYDSFDTCYDPTNSPQVQENVKKCIGLMEDSTRLISLTGVFSSNEGIEEVASEDLKYFMLPYLLGQLMQKLCNVDRKEVVDTAEVYYQDFLKRCEDYNLCEKDERVAHVEPQINSSDQMQQLARSFQDRNAKLRMYQERKDLETEIKKMKIAIENENVDEDVKRDYYLKLLKSCIFQAKDEIKSLEMEKQCLAHIEVMRREDPDHGKHSHQHQRPPVRPLRPIIITKDALQKAVYGAGYPSLPTMTVDEFYDQRVAEGIFPDEEQAKIMNKNSLMNRVYEDHTAEDEKEDEEKEQLVEQDDEEYMARQRAKDDFKDEHRRGYGNRHNRS